MKDKIYCQFSDQWCQVSNQVRLHVRDQVLYQVYHQVWRKFYYL